MDVIPDEEWERFERRGEVLVIRNGERRYEELSELTLTDLPAVLDTLVVLDEERKVRERAEMEAKAEERKRVKRVRAKEKRKREKLG